MKYEGYIAAAYAIALGVTLLLSGHSVLRMRTASRRLRAVDPRLQRGAR